MLAELQPFGFGPFRIEHPSGLLATFVGLAILLYLLYRFALPGARTTLLERATQIETEQAQIQRQSADVEQLRNDYATRIQMIEKEQRERISAAVQDAENARAQIIADAEEAARALRRRGEEEIARERTRQRILLRQQIVQITLEAAEQAIRSQNSDDMQRHLISDFVARVAANSPEGSSANGAQNNGMPVATMSTVTVTPLVSTAPAVTLPTPTGPVTGGAGVYILPSTSDDNQGSLTAPASSVTQETAPDFTGVADVKTGQEA